jgi:CspA family cold shock protein
MVSVGVVREFHAVEGWGVVDGADVPGGCWVHFSAIAMDGYRQLTPGQRVSYSAEAADQDGFRFRAVTVWPDGVEPDLTRLEPRANSVAYRSSLTITFDEPEGR